MKTTIGRKTIVAVVAHAVARLSCQAERDPKRTSPTRKAALAALLALTVASAFSAQVASGDAVHANSAALPLWQRVLQGGELKGFDPQPAPPKILTLKAFVKEAAGAYVRITTKTAYRELKSAGFKAATISLLSAKDHQTARASLIVASTVVELGSPQQARRVLQWAYFDSLSPCPNACNVRIEPFRVSGIPGAVAVRRSRTKDAPGTGPTNPFEAYDIEFTDGPFLYDLFAVAPQPGMFDRNNLIAAVKAQYRRVKAEGA